MKFILFFLIIPFICFAQSEPEQKLSFKVAEVKVEVFRNNEENGWTPVKNGDVLPDNTQILTGLHSSLSLDLTEKSYITISQLSDVVLQTTRIKKFTLTTEIYIVSGMIITSSEKLQDLDNEINVMFINGKATLKNAAGQIYMRKGYGVTLLAENGDIEIEQNILRKNIKRKIYPGDKCLLKMNGQLVENHKIVEHEMFMSKSLNDSSAKDFFSRTKSKNSYSVNSR